jgi:hypothetical protein
MIIMSFLKKVIQIVLMTTVLSIIGYHFVPQFRVAIDQKIEWVFPCDTKITYSIGNFDTEFGITKDEFLSIIKSSESLWEKASNKDLFEYVDSNGKLVVNLIYDERQSSTDFLRKLGYVINSDKATYDNLKSRYDSLKLAFEQSKAELSRDITNLKRDQELFEEDVKYWNSRGGAPKNEYTKLEKWKNDLNELIKDINSRQDKLNQSVNTINSLSTVLNKFSSTLSSDVEKYNNSQENLGEEFDQGEYVLDRSGRYINIYQFDDNDKLKRVLAHELGHALGLTHNDNPKSIMYRLNNSKDLILSENDLLSLKLICNIK